MRSILVTGSDTGVGKTHVVAALARRLARAGACVQVVKVVETGRGPGDVGDAEAAGRAGGAGVEAATLVRLREPLAPPCAAAADGVELSCAELAEAARRLRECDWRILEGAGGICTPLDDEANDWVDYARAAAVDAIVIVVPDRLGAINQARLAYARARAAGVPAGVWLNATAPVDARVARSTRAGLAAAGVPLWAEQDFGAPDPRPGLELVNLLAPLAPAVNAPEPGPRVGAAETDGGGDVTCSVNERMRARLAERDASGLRRSLRVTAREATTLNLADNDYLALASDPVVVAACGAAAARHGTSASASPLIAGWGELHAGLAQRLAAWHGMKCGLLWSSGYAANAAVLGGLPARGDVVFADRLIHHSMVAGLRRSGARLQRYPHLDLDRLEQLLETEHGRGRQVFVVTESVFSMDGDHPDLSRLAALKRRHGFFWIVDEAHAVGWYGPQGAGLVRAAELGAGVDVLIGTLGKALGSGGGYTLFGDEVVRDYVVNTAGEFIYSTALPPPIVAAAAAALERVAGLASEQPEWHARSLAFRRQLSAAGWKVPDGDSPIVPVLLDSAEGAVALADSLRSAGILVGAIRPPTVPAGTSRLRVSLKRTFREEDATRVVSAMNAWRAAR